MTQFNDLPSEKLLVAYWLADVGIGKSGHMQDVKVPLTDILKYKLKDGTPQIKVVIIAMTTLKGTPENFNPPYIDIADDIKKVMTVQHDQTESEVKQLQNKKVKVLLSVIGNNSLGWDNIPPEKNDDFAQWIKTEVIEKYGLDGIDLDDENGSPNPQGFLDTVGVLRYHLADKLITKPLWQDQDYFSSYQVSSKMPNAGKYLGEMLDLGATMAYGWDFNDQLNLIKQYHDVTGKDGKNVGLSYNKLCIGVQASIPSHTWATPIKEVGALAQWVVEPQSASKPIPPILGMMLWTFSQDIQQFTYEPQNSSGKTWPNPDDHEWQKTIIEGMWGSDNWIVAP